MSRFLIHHKVHEIWLGINQMKMLVQFEALSRNPDLLVATPGRLLHHIAETKMSLSLVQYLVFDEVSFRNVAFTSLLNLLKTIPTGGPSI